ncbi:hypothetical protein CCAX7_51270 [Capsulimonas corticalis]|uniref:Uncharacterized protein n=1 Tax=Capsulimonas corticalis TaxID=2219043 RepID=A0A402CP27_9BACT|nr:transglutaminase-like domain-containing protein [Capsulimonas corticalis]BDI33076.1 hypothetical protein CCAX7_51270 [Capsulimonas corticalis]
MMARYFSLLLAAGIVCLSAPLAFAGGELPPVWHLEKDGPGVRMTAHLERRVVTDGEPVDTLFATPTPPTLPWQDHIVARMSVDGRPAGDQVTEGSAHKRKVTVAEFNQTKAVTVATDITAMVYRFRVVAGPPKAAVPDLSRAERAHSLASIGNLDYQTPKFQAYIARHDLTWRRHAGESLDDFIQRAARQVKNDFTYFDGDQDRHVSALAASCRGDCGAINGVFAAVMRQNGVPAQLWAGFRRLPTMPDAWQPHVIASVFVPKSGWLPVDLVSGDQVVFAMSGENNAVFVTHIDDGFVLNPKGWSTLCPDWMQPTAFYYRGGKIVSGLDCAAEIKFSKAYNP